MNPKPTARLTVAAAMLALAGLTGCAAGGGDQSSAANLPTLESGQDRAAGGAATTSDEQDESQPDERDIELAMAEFEDCMADHGIEVSSAIAGDGGAEMSQESHSDATAGASDVEISIEDFEAAAEECDELLDGVIQDLDDLSPEQRAELADMNLQFEQCMAEQGFDVSPDESGAFTLGPEIDFDEFEAASNDCSSAFALEEGR